MKRIIFLIAISFYVSYAVAQTAVTGVITVQNSKVNTGKTETVPNAQVSSQNAQPGTTDNEGKFRLRFSGVEQGQQVQIAVTPYGTYKEYVVVNEKELRDITLGRVTPVSVYVCKKGDLEQRQAEMVGINMRKLEERMDKDKNRLQKELEALKAKNDYLNVRYSQIKDSLDIISKNIDKAFERIKEYAQNMVLENLDDKDNNYVKAYDCFSKGELDSVAYYLSDQELELKHQKILQLQEEAKKEKELAEILTASAKAKEEFTENSLNELIKEWLLLARTYNMKNDYEKTMHYYEKAILADTLHAENSFEFAKYLHSIREYSQAEKYYLQCLALYRKWEKENPNTYLADVARTLNRLAHLHRIINEHAKAEEEYKEALEIRKKLAAENPKTYLADLATTLNDLAVLHWSVNEHQKALEKYVEALEIRRKLATEKPKEYSADLALTLNNLAVLHWNLKEYPKALEEYKESLEIRRKLATENPKTYLADVAQTLNNIAVLHWNTKEYTKAEEEYKESLKIRRELANENPKAYLDKVAQTLENLAILHKATKEYPKALEEYEEALNINRNLALENPKAYLPYVARTLDNLANLHVKIKKYEEALKEYEEALKTHRKLATENPKVYLASVATTLSNLSLYYLFTQEYTQAEQHAREALQLDSTALRGKICIAHALLFQNRFAEAEKIYKELSQTIYQTHETYSQTILDDFNDLEEAGAIPPQHQENVGKIRGMISGEK